MAAKLWMVSSGKGGVGKTFITSSLGITLSKLEKKVLLIDCDSEGANLHTLLGQPLSKITLSDYWSGNKKLKECVLEAQIPRLSYIQGQWEQWSRADLNTKDMQRLATDARDLSYDIVIFDMGSGANKLNLELFECADEKFLVINPELTSIEKTYRFIESIISNQLQKNCNNQTYQKVIEAISTYRYQHKIGITSFRDFISEFVDTKSLLDLDQKPVRILVNQSRSQQDRDLGYSMQSVCRKYYDMPVSYIGHLDFDNAVWQSVRIRRPVLIDKPFTPLAGQLLSVAKDLTQSNFISQFFKAVV